MKQKIAEFYAGQRILVTGGTGFMGKVLVEKILRSCPDVERIYLLMRSKKGTSMEERWKEVTDKPLFDKLKIIRPEMLKKVTLISGDISKEELGLSNNDKQVLQKNVTVIFHAAADVQFSDNIDDALVQNVKATKCILDLARSIENVKVFVHLSTAYSNFNLLPSESIEEILPSCQDWRDLLKLRETELNTLRLLKEKLLCDHPNPYTWSKSLAEQVVNEYSQYFPTVVMRPAVVIATLREDPFIGWVDSLNGLSGTAIMCFLGFLKLLPVEGDCFSDVIPVDIVTRALLISAKKAAETKERLAVYNSASAKLEPIRFKDLHEHSKVMMEDYPVKERVWVPDVSYVTNPFLHSIYFLLLQVVPSFFLDIIYQITTNKIMFMKISKKLAVGSKIFLKFMDNKVAFPIDKYERLEDYLDENDKKEFSIDMSDLPLTKNEIIANQTLGILKYGLKCDLSNEVENRKHFNRIKTAKKTFDCIKYLTLCWLSWYPVKYLFFAYL